MKKIFINPSEKRLRAGWRIATYFLSFFAVAALANLLLKNVLPVRIVRSMIAIPVISMIALGTLGLAGRYLDRRKFKDYGFHLSPRWWLDFLFGFLLSAVLFTLIFLVEKALGWITILGYFQNQREGYLGQPFVIPFLIGLIACVIVGFYEEILFRANLMTNLSEGLNKKKSMAKKALLWGYILSCIVFGLSHSINPNATLAGAINIALGGLFLGLPYVLTGELAISIALHISWNFFQGLVFGFPVSGVSENTAVIAIRQGGPQIWTGGTFGPEAGLVGTVAIIMGCVLVWVWLKSSRRPTSLFIKLAEYRPPKQDKTTAFS